MPRPAHRSYFHHRRAFFSAAMITAALLTACGSDDEAGAPHNDQDIEFARNMIPHHSQAVDMAELVPQRSDNAEVEAIADDIRSGQQPEIDRMNDFLRSWNESAVDATSGHDGHSGHSNSDMPGMMSEDALTSLEHSSGSAFDKSFLSMMVEHHQGAITMARAELDKGLDQSAKMLADSIIQAQQTEVTRMQELIPTITPS
jgi:uncharacterized protein (DUF305 family)